MALKAGRVQVTEPTFHLLPEGQLCRGYGDLRQAALPPQGHLGRRAGKMELWLPIGRLGLGGGRRESLRGGGQLSPPSLFSYLSSADLVSLSRGRTLSHLRGVLLTSEFQVNE